MKESGNLHINQLAGDYILGLLPAEKMQYVTGHIAWCVACQQVVQAEREIGRLTRETLVIAGRPDSNRLRALMPRPLIHKSSRRAVWQWQRYMTVAALFMLVVLSGITLEINRRNVAWPVASPTSHHSNTSIAGTPTYTSTVTVAQVRPIDSVSTINFVATPAEQTIVISRPAVVPVPAAPILGNAP